MKIQEIFKDTRYAFRVTFLNKCDELERKLSQSIIKDVLEKTFPSLLSMSKYLKMEKKNIHLEDFKEAITSTVRSISEIEDCKVIFGDQTKVAITLLTCLKLKN